MDMQNAEAASLVACGATILFAAIWIVSARRTPEFLHYFVTNTLVFVAVMIIGLVLL